MEVYLPHYLKKEYGKKLNKTEIDEEALKIIGFGIPTEGLNSIDFIKVAGFLPHTMGSTVIVPQEMVAKSGADYDIDKLTESIKEYYSILDTHIKEIRNALINDVEEQAKEVAENPMAYLTSAQTKKFKKLMGE